MRVFITGASGHIGSAVVPELLGAGHTVVGLARSDEAATRVSAAGAEVRRGELDDLETIREEAEAADGVIHLAFKHDWMQTGDFAAAAASDLSVVETVIAALEGTDKPFVVTSGTMLLTMAGVEGRAGTEDDTAAAGPRIDSENAAIAAAQRGVRSSAIRLAPTVHSSLDTHGFVPSIIAIARERGTSGYVGEGANRWPAVHTLDAARLYRLALESAPAGSRLHGVAEEGVRFRQIAEAIAQELGIEPVRVSPEEAEERFGFLARFVATDNPTSSRRTRELLGWEPTQPGLIDDLAAGHYFA